MIVLDTHVWVWWHAAPWRLSRLAGREIERADTIGISSMSVFEVVELADRRRIVLDTPVRAWVRDALRQDRVKALPLTTIDLDAAQLRFEPNPADRIIYATARSAKARLITRDERIRAFDRELAVW